MKLYSRLVLVSLMLTSTVTLAVPLRLHPVNPHYLEFRNQPIVLVTSGKHYGAVINLDFDYITYLNTLQADGLNNTRLFTGVFVISPTDIQIPKSPLGPDLGRLIAPWARSNTTGYRLGGNKFNLNAWDPAYFSRLRDFVAQAGQRGIIVEINLFCIFYNDDFWLYSPCIHQTM